MTMYEPTVNAVATSACSSTPSLWTKIEIQATAKIADPSGGAARTREMMRMLYVCLNSSPISRGSEWIFSAIVLKSFPSSGP